MALIPCPECRQQVSERATACPHCGLALVPSSLSPSPPQPSAAAARAGAPMAWASAAPAEEEVVWEGGASPRLLARELPGIAWALALPALALWALPIALDFVGSQRRDLGVAIAQQGAAIRWLVIGIVLLLSLTRLARVAVRYARIKAARYRLTNQRLTIEGGMIAKRVDDIDLRLVQDVALEQSPLERLLGVGRLDIVSSDHARPRLVLIGIVAPRDVREQIRACAYQASQRQLFTRAT